MKTKQEESEEIADQVNEFLAKGGKIEQVDTTILKSHYAMNRQQRKIKDYFANTNRHMFNARDKSKDK